MKNLISRKEARELLGMSDATFRRRLKDLNIECVSEMLPNGIESKKIAYEDYIRLAESVGKKPVEKRAAGDSSQELTLYGLKMELVRSQLSLENALKNLDEKNEYIRKLENKNDQQEKVNELAEIHPRVMQEYKKLEPIDRLPSLDKI